MVYKYKELCRFSFFRKEVISSLVEYAKVRVLMEILTLGHQPHRLMAAERKSDIQLDELAPNVACVVRDDSAADVLSSISTCVSV
jgi:hypothetical protein